MKKITIYGPGCKRCEATEIMVKNAASRLGVKVKIMQITDATRIAKAGVMSTPGIAVDGALVHAGGLPDAEKLESWLQA